MKKPLITVLVLIIIISAYAWWQNRTTLVSVPTQIGATNGWKTYRNEKYGFEFKYPNEFGVKEMRNSDSYKVLLHINLNSSESKGSLFVTKKEPERKLEDLVPTCVADDSNICVPVPSAKSFRLGMVAGLTEGTSYYFLNPHDNNLVFILVYSGVQPSGEERFNQILSTFKFIN